MFRKFDYKYFIVKYFPVIRHRFAVYAFLKSVFTFLRHIPGSSLYFGPPRGFYISTEQHNKANKNSPIKELFLEDEKVFVRELPVTNSLLVKEKFERLLKTFVIQKKGYVLNRARYFSGYAGTVVTSDDKILIPCSPLKNAWKPHQHDSLYKLKLPKAQHLKKVVLVDTKGALNNYGHWLRDHLARFYWLSQMDLDLSEYTLVSTFANTPYQRFSYELMKLKGYNFQNYISTVDIKHLKADVLVVPPYTNHVWNADEYSYDVKESTFIKRLFLEDSKSIETYERIYISRRKARRSSPQETELVEKLTHLGITEVFLEDYTISQQASLFNSAKLIIGFHGSGFANQYFCEPGTAIVEIFSPDYIITDFWDQGRKTNLQYFAYSEDSLKKDLAYRLANQDATSINVDNFINFCKENNLLKSATVYNHY